MHIYSLIFPESDIANANVATQYTVAKIQSFFSHYIFLFPYLGLLHCRQILYQLSYEGSPICVQLQLFREKWWWGAAIKADINYIGLVDVYIGFSHQGVVMWQSIWNPTDWSFSFWLWNFGQNA